MLHSPPMLRDERKQQVMVGLAVLAGVAALILLIASGRHLPGLGGEFFGRVLGIITTPFLMETSFIILGFVLVMSLNLWRRHRDGDEFVDLDRFSEDLPESAREAASSGPGLGNGPPSAPRGSD